MNGTMEEWNNGILEDLKTGIKGGFRVPALLGGECIDCIITGSTSSHITITIMSVYHYVISLGLCIQNA